MFANLLTSVAAAVTGGYAYTVLRPNFKTKVNCWFCGENTKVAFYDKNHWNCPHCDQYNGFNKDGGYNKEIPGQFADKPKIWKLLTDRKYTGYIKKDLISDNGLCVNCNKNQTLKISVLKNYVPHEKRTEATEYMNRLEKIFRLCSPCQTYVNTKLQLQDIQLSNQYLHLNSAQPSPSIGPLEKAQTKNRAQSVLRFLVLLIALLLLPVEINKYCRYFDVDFSRNITVISSDLSLYDLQVVCQVFAVFFTETERRLLMDVACCILCIFSSSSFVDKLSNYFSCYWPFHIMLCSTVAICCFFGERGGMSVCSLPNDKKSTNARGKISRLPISTINKNNRVGIKPFSSLTPNRGQYLTPQANVSRLIKEQSNVQCQFDFRPQIQTNIHLSSGHGDFTRHMQFLKLGFDQQNPALDVPFKLFDYSIENVDRVPALSTSRSIISPSHFSRLK